MPVGNALRGVPLSRRSSERHGGRSLQAILQNHAIATCPRQVPSCPRLSFAPFRAGEKGGTFSAFPGYSMETIPTGSLRCAAIKRNGSASASPFYEHNEAQAFVAYRRGEVCGRWRQSLTTGISSGFRRTGLLRVLRVRGRWRGGRATVRRGALVAANMTSAAFAGRFDPAMDYGIGISLTDRLAADVPHQLQSAL